MMWANVATAIIAGTVGFGGAWIGAYVRLIKLNGAVERVAQALEHEVTMRQKLESDMGECRSDHIGHNTNMCQRVSDAESRLSRIEGGLSAGQ